MMNDQHKFLDPEEMVSCPYNIAHTCPRKRLAFHLIKCRKQHVELAKELRECIHNCQHRIPRPEYEYHIETCPDRENYYQAHFKVGEDVNESIPALMENIKIPVNLPQTDENWDEGPAVDVLANVKREAESKNVLENFSNEPPAVRKALREESRRKHREKMKMNDQSKFIDPEEMVSCPYEVSHSCPRKRLALHLTKCRKQHLEMAKDMRQCIHNVQHTIPRAEYEYHLEICPDRDNYYQKAYQIGDDKADCLPALMSNLNLPVNLPASEQNWEDSDGTNVLANIQRAVQNKIVFNSFSNEPPAVRKALREENRQKMREILNEEDERRKYDDDDRVSVGSSKSQASSADTDVSFKTALSYTTSKLCEFPEMEPKEVSLRGRGRGRSRGQIMSQKPNIQYGIGRSRHVIRNS